MLIGATVTSMLSLLVAVFLGVVLVEVRSKRKIRIESIKSKETTPCTSSSPS